MNFEVWKREVSERIEAEPEWKFYAYPKTLFLYDLPRSKRGTVEGLVKSYVDS